LALAAMLFAAGCKSPSSPSASVTSFVAGVTTSSTTPIQATQRAGAPPAANGGPPVTATGPQTAVNNGGGAYELVSATPFLKAIVSVSTSASTAPDGFFELTLPAETTSVSVVVSYGPSIPSSFSARFQAVTAAGLVGPESVVPITLTAGNQGRASLTATASPNPAPFLNGAACVLFPLSVCGYEFQVTFRELNGVGVTLTSSQESFNTTFGPHSVAFPVTTIGPRGTASVSRGVLCDITDVPCRLGFSSVGNQQQTFGLSVSGTDANGNPVTLSTSIVLLPR
jgi:hypothetical protein